MYYDQLVEVSCTVLVGSNYLELSFQVPIVNNEMWNQSCRFKYCGLTYCSYANSFSILFYFLSYYFIYTRGNIILLCI